MVQIPDPFFRKVCLEMNLPEKGRYGSWNVIFLKQ